MFWGLSVKNTKRYDGTKHIKNKKYKKKRIDSAFNHEK